MLLNILILIIENFHYPQYRVTMTNKIKVTIMIFFQYIYIYIHSIFCFKLSKVLVCITNIKSFEINEIFYYISFINLERKYKEREKRKINKERKE